MDGGLLLDWTHTPRTPQSYMGVTAALSDGIGGAAEVHPKTTFGTIGQGLQMLLKSTQDGPNAIYTALKWTEKALRASSPQDADSDSALRPLLRGVTYALFATFQVKEGKVYQGHQTLDKIPDLIPEAATGLSTWIGGDESIHQEALMAGLHAYRHHLDPEESLSPAVERTLNRLCSAKGEQEDISREWCSALMALGLTLGFNSR